LLITMSRCFASVVDRNLIDEAMWDLYIECCNEDNYAPVTLIVDADTILQEPRYSYNCNIDEFSNDSDIERDTGEMMKAIIKFERRKIVEKGEEIKRLVGMIRNV